MVGSSAASDKHENCHVGVVLALKVEASGFVNRLTDIATTRGPIMREHVGRLNCHDIAVVESGAGGQRAALVTEDLIRLRRPTWVVSAGFAGALSDQIRKGDVLMADSVVDTNGNTLEIDLKIDPAASPAIHVGRLLSTEKVIRQTEQKRKMSSKFGALAVDMESYAVADVCRREKVRFLSVRMIVDGIDDQLPPEIDYLLRQQNAARQLGAAAGAILRRPSSARDMWKLRQAAWSISDQLGKFLCGVIVQLPTEVEK